MRRATIGTALLAATALGGCYLSHVVDDDGAVPLDARVPPPPLVDAGSPLDASFTSCPASDPVVVLDVLARTVGGPGCQVVHVPATAPATATCFGSPARTVRVVANVGNDIEFRATITSLTHDTPSGNTFLDPTTCACRGPTAIDDTSDVGHVEAVAVGGFTGSITLEVGLLGDGVDFDLEVCALHF